MIVVHMFRIGDTADRADPTLLGQQLIDLCLPDPVPPPQVVFAESTVQPELALLALHVVARLAVTAVATPP
ncbi:hypothetical protein GCM10011608_59430 [Micromonospora sonchi]|uniref:Uncharacterized protein n=1 Tax=Micromonospora sonchi TaxID=1763543 RepID=A0A917U8H9_9ACTN|nr:hypothetical protein GCM10011608_59430 [Micromonospora sonchi]